jgi:uridine kinase
MLGDIINIRGEYFDTSKEILAHLKSQSIWDNEKLVVGIAGESGSGKSVTAICLQHTLSENGKTALILHLDDYFKLPPKTNHENRLQNIDAVGASEVNMELLQENLNTFKSGKTEMYRPLVNYKLNQILAENIPLQSYDCLIVEGTYTFLLENIDALIFMDRTYIETKTQRDERGRDVQNEFVERVLEIEHNLIRPAKKRAMIVVDKSYRAVVNSITL